MSRLIDTIFLLRGIVAKGIKSGAEITLDEQNAIEKAIAAIKKQIREKPVRVNECPACRTHMMIKHNFCPTCGQALDWQQEG